MEGIDFSPRLEYLDIKPLSEIVEFEIPSSKNILVYFLQVSFQSYRWKLMKTFNELLKCIKRFKSKLVDAFPIPKYRKLKELNITEQRELFMSLFREFMNTREIYDDKIFKEFLEVSHMSFKGNVVKRKEGFVKKQTGGRVGNEKKFCNFNKYFKRFQKRWMMVRDSGVFLSKNKDAERMSDLLMYDNKFSIQFSKETKYEDGILISNSKRNLLIRTGSLLKMIEWKLAIEDASKCSEYGGKLQQFGSLYPERKGNKVRIYIDGEDYFHKVYQKLKAAKHQVFISDWWLSPELHLKRPAIKNPKTKLMDVLHRIAERGVSVYVHVYKELASALTLNSKHTVNTLRNLHKNIRAIRHPKRSIYGGQFLWSHHEKVICIDQEVAFLGGLDMCYGRMDNKKHRLKDDGAKPFWNGIDYSNSRIKDFENVEDWKTDRLDRKVEHRMPWHDVSLMIRGDAAYDVSVNYIELWNHVMTDFYGWKAGDKDLLTPMRPNPHFSDSRTNSNASASKQGKDINIAKLDDIPVDQSEIQMLRRSSIQERKSIQLTLTEEIKRQEYGIRGSIARVGQEGSCHCQIVRSAGLWSYGLEAVDHSIRTAYLELIDEANYFIYIENQFFISCTAGDPVENTVAQALTNKIIAKASRKEPFKVIVLMPLLPGFAGEVDSNAAAVLRIQMHWQYKTICRGSNSIYSQLQDAGINPMDYIRFYGLRTHDVFGETPVTEIVYIHSKLMVIDDNKMIIGSANINDRSMMGNHDSEIAVVITDDNKVKSLINGQKVMVSKTVFDFRMRAFREFVGECKDSDIVDPFSTSFVKEFEGTAENNKLKYREVFHCYPDDEISSFKSLAKPEESELKRRYREQKNSIKGFLVEFPLSFLDQEDLTFKTISMENLVPEKSFI